MIFLRVRDPGFLCTVSNEEKGMHKERDKDVQRLKGLYIKQKAKIMKQFYPASQGYQLPSSLLLKFRFPQA